jgi:hypothetical protein
MERDMADTKMVTPGALDKLAKLLAAENIMIEHKPIKTAYFDVKNRVLALPMWKEMTESLYHMLVLHEVGHALDTPAEGWKGSIDKVKEEDGGRTAQTFQGYLNVVEDARIERKIKNKFPGSRKDFIDGYNWLHDQDFFGVKAKDVDAMTLIDRINLYFKLGTRIRINFTDEERAFVRRAEQTITFDDVIKLAQDIMAYAKAKNEEEQQQTTAMEDMIGDEDSDEFSHDDFDADDAQESENDGDGDEESEQQEGSDENRAQGGQNGSEGGRNPEPLEHGSLDSMTDRAMNDRMEELLDEKLTGREFRYIMFPKDLAFEPFTHSYKEVLGWVERDFAKGGSVMTGYRAFLLNKFRMENNAAINYMVKEFEVKKAAIAYSRSKQAKTGVIDTNKLHSYKFNDDIFKRLSIEPTGKNHGVVSILDMSGSMSPSYRGAMDQLISLAMFCRRVGIPHRFYGFTSVIPYDKKCRDAREALKEKIAARLNKNFVFPADGDCDLLELFHEGMSLKDFNTMVGALLVSSTRYGNGHFVGGTTDEYVEAHGYTSPYNMIVSKMGHHDMEYFKLGGTPLNDAILLSRDLMRKFRKEKNIQIMNYICITDGESNHSTYVTNRRGYGNQLLVDAFPNYSSKTVTNIFVDEETHMQTTINFNDGGIGVTGMFARMVRESENARFIGFYIANSTYDIRNAIYRYLPYTEQEKARNAMAKSGSTVIPKMLNFDEFYLIRGGKNLEAQQAKFEEAKDMKKGQLARAFISAQNKRGTSRVILGRFIEKIAA